MIINVKMTWKLKMKCHQILIAAINKVIFPRTIRDWIVLPKVSKVLKRH